MKLYLQNIIDKFQFENLPIEWQQFDFSYFSEKKKLFDYQQCAFKNALKALYKYYIDYKANKSDFFTLYQNNGFIENLDYKINGNKKLKIFEDFDKDYEIENNTIAFHHFINRMSFWMATGSGKTLVIVKLLELLGNLIKSNQIPHNDILFLTYREDLIEQFKNHIDEFNGASNSISINLYSIKDYDKLKREAKLKYINEIDVFFYRSDLISNEHKDKIIDFRNYDNDGKWYLLLDEAHKGDKEDSKRQLYYSILSRNGYMFNFSATFTDPIDFATCVFNFNLEKFIQQGYGKHIYISQTNVTALAQVNDFTEQQKQITVLKILLLHTLIRKTKSIIRDYYHNPLILTLVNSVNTEDSDLELFFKELVKIANNSIGNDLFEQAKLELNDELKGQCEFDNEELKIDNSTIESLTLQDILENVFNANTNGNIEVLKIPGNKQELIFKLTTSEKPFALIKIGDISEWLRNKLSHYEIIERFDNESVFKKINNDDSDITILMGSRAFYEGWDSNRPNIILYINIGKGTDAKKFVLQSIGRGVRIEPLPNKRKRFQFLYNNNDIDKAIYDVLKPNVNILETLFVYGTKTENLKEVIETLKEEKQEELIGDLFEINQEVKDKLLLIPVYKESDKILVDEDYDIKYEINNIDLNLIKDYYNYIGDKIALFKYDCQPKVLKKISESFLYVDKYYKIDSNVEVLEKPDVLMKGVINHFSLRLKEFEKFKQLGNEIIHFKQIKISDIQREKIEQKIKQVLNYKEKDKRLSEVAKKIQNEPQKVLEYTKEIENITHNYIKESEVEYRNEKIKFKYLPNHYYLPVVLSENEKLNYIVHIIKTKSEVDFISDLEKYLEKEDNFFKQFDWWFFSKIDETLDDVYIPYYQPKTKKIEKFKPDFIFWMKKNNNYNIMFVDPKSPEFTNYEHKIDGYKRLFENKEFNYNGLSVSINLLFYTDDLTKVSTGYRNYWFDNFINLSNKTNLHDTA
ncbi:DEAD/DEAH box helicase family protein [Rosettibacter firmus]|uniref:DEAD/DEAH box helicase family protein n=1 Tax=Rosettibacter firmus TaxID=3111522 RepID=UPI00336BCAE8